MGKERENKLKRESENEKTKMTIGPASGDSRGHGNSEQDDRAAFFECNVCLDVAKEPVVSLCGHLFCWSCIHQWIETRPQKQECPVCKAGIGKEKMIPIYGRGQESKDPRKNCHLDQVAKDRNLIDEVLVHSVIRLEMGIFS